MGKCKLIGAIHMCNYWTSTGSMIMFSHWWVIFEGSVMFCSYSELHATYCHLNSGMRFCAKWRKSLTDGKWCWTVCLTKLVPFSFAYLIFFLPIFNNIDLNVYLKDVHVHQWNASYCVGFHSQYVSSQQTVLLSWSHSKVKSYKSHIFPYFCSCYSCVVFRYSLGCHTLCLCGIYSICQQCYWLGEQISNAFLFYS